MNSAEQPLASTTAGGDSYGPTQDRPPVTVVLVRHGETVDTPKHTFAGGMSLGPSLSNVGQQQAARAARVAVKINDLWGIDPIEFVVHSPMVRAKETGQAIANACKVPMREDSAFRECEFGIWENRKIDEVRAENPELFNNWIAGSVPLPDGESIWDVSQRVGDGLLKLAAEFSGKTIAVAAHAVVMRAALGAVLNLQPRTFSRLRVPPASISIMRIWPEKSPEGLIEACLDVALFPSEVVEHNF